MRDIAEKYKKEIDIMIHLTTENFEKEVINSNIPVAVDFWATWCGPCKRFAPVFEELDNEYSGKVKLCKVDTSEYAAVAAQFGVVQIPTVVVFKNGKEVKRIVGVHEADVYEEIFDDLI